MIGTRKFDPAKIPTNAQELDASEGKRTMKIQIKKSVCRNYFTNSFCTKTFMLF